MRFAAVFGAVVILVAAIVVPAPLWFAAAWHTVASVSSVFEQNHGSESTELNLAAKSGNVERVKTLAKDRTSRHESGFPATTVRVAAENGQTAVLDTLIRDFGWDVNKPVYRHAPGTAVDFAAKHFHSATVRFLMTRGARLHTKMDLGVESVLARLCDERSNDPIRRQNALEIARLLIAAGEPVEVARDGGPDPLRLAIRSNFPEMVALLIDSGASVDRVSTRMGTPLQAAQARGCARCESLIAEALTRK